MKKYNVQFDLFLVDGNTSWVAPAIYDMLENDNGENYYNFTCTEMQSSEEGLKQFRFIMDLIIGDNEPSPNDWLNSVLSDNLEEFEYEYNTVITLNDRAVNHDSKLA